MLVKYATKKILVVTLVLFTFYLLTLFPKDTKITEVNYEKNIELSNIYLLNDYNYLSKTSIICDEEDIISKAKCLLNSLIIGNEEKIRNGFKPLIPSETKILNLEYEDNIIIVDFSKELLDTDIIYEEKIIESIIYTLTDIDNVDGIKILIEGELLRYLPKNDIYLNEILKRNYGINKIYDLDDIHNINSVVIYYLAKNNDNTYYVPVTYYSNNSKEKVEIIIDELSSNNLYNTNLMSYLNSNTKLLNVKEVDNNLELEFNEYIFNDLNSKDILEEVLYTISLSINDNYDVESFSIIFDNEEIYKKLLNSF